MSKYLDEAGLRHLVTGLCGKIGSAVDRLAGDVAILPFDSIVPSGSVWIGGEGVIAYLEGNHKFTTEGANAEAIMAEYNGSDGCPRADRLYRCGNTLYRWTGEKLAALADEQAVSELVAPALKAASQSIAILPFNGIREPGTIVIYGTWYDKERKRFDVPMSVTGFTDEYNGSDGHPRTDCLYRCGNALYRWTGDDLVRMVDETDIPAAPRVWDVEVDTESNSEEWYYTGEILSKWGEQRIGDKIMFTDPANGFIWELTICELDEDFRFSAVMSNNATCYFLVFADDGIIYVTEIANRARPEWTADVGTLNIYDHLGSTSQYTGTLLSNYSNVKTGDIIKLKHWGVVTEVLAYVYADGITAYSISPDRSEECFMWRFKKNGKVSFCVPLDSSNIRDNSYIQSLVARIQALEAK